MRPFALARVLLVGLLLGFVSQAAFAQTLPPPTSDDTMGLQPYQSYHGGDIDSIGLTTGMLNLNFPFLSYPQRGKLHLSFNLFYNNRPQHLGELCTPNGKGGQNCEFLWGYTTNPSIFPLDRGDVVVAWGQQLGVFATDTADVLNQGKSDQITIYNVNLALQTADGSKHVLGNLGTVTKSSNTTQIFYGGSGPWESLDATGWRVNGAMMAAAGSGYQGTAVSIIDAEGTAYATANAAEEDPNGNMILASTTALTDSLGRQIVFPPTSASKSNTDTSGCPQTPLPVDFAVQWSVPGPTGSTVNYKFCYATVTEYTPPGGGEQPAGGPDPLSKLQTTLLPNGQSWNFAYNDPGDGSTYNGNTINYGTLTQVTLPTGGTISYTYETAGGLGSCQNEGRWVTSRTVNANDGAGPHTWTYAYTFGTGSVVTSTTVTDPLGNYTVHTFTGYGAGCSLYETEAQSYQVGGTLLKTVTTAFNFGLSRNTQDGADGSINVVPTQITTTWPNGKTSQVTKSYDSGFNYTDYLNGTTNNEGTQNTGIYGKVLTETASDYGQGTPGPVLRTTTNTYQALNSSAYLTNNLLDLPASIKVTGGSQTAYTTYGYDETGPVSSGITTQHDSAPPDGASRGNQTSIHRQLNNGSATAVGTCPAVSSGGYLVSNITYFDTGMPDVSKDPCAYSTTYAYSSTYFGAFPTTVTNTLGQSTTHTYDLNTGLLGSTTDPNSQTTNFTYDNMWRPASVTYPDGGSATITRQETTFPNTVTLTKKITSSQNYVMTNVFDGLGRVTQGQLNSAPGGSILTDTTYDADGRKSTVSNPYVAKTDPTYGITTYQYDALNRTTLVIPPDGTSTSNNVATQYCGGRSTLVTDQAGHWRRSTTDGLGRLVEVDEPNSLTATVNVCPGTGEPIWVTSYTYDVLGDLLTVVQGGSHNRSFIYDSLKRLTSSTNPETGATPVTYTYDADSNVTAKKDARTFTISYSYDNLNRITGRTYSNGDPAVTYSYDQSGCLGLAACYNIGRRTAMTDADGSESWAYDKLGRELAEQRITSSITNSTAYTYNLDGSLATLKYPSLRTINYAYDSAARPISALDTANGINYAQGGAYAPQGALSALTLGPAGSFAGINLSNTYNKRLQPNELKVWSTAGTAMDLTYSFVDASSHNNGNVIAITNNRDTTRSQSFTYDQVNRIVTAETGSTYATSPTNCWGESYTYDQWANLTAIGAASSSYTGCTQESLSVTALTNNQLSATGFSYDASGNILTDGHNTYGWNAESEIKSAAGVNYTYDGDGNRVQKSNGKIYWYGAGTEILDESDASGNITDEYVYFGGKRVAHRVVSGNTISYYAEDLLGSSRAIATSAGALCYDADFYPFGGERIVTNTCAQNYKFEGKERDAETNNDDFGARYYSSQFGRWTSPDWSAIPEPVPYANLTNPQTLNLYAMVSDNPETFADLDGHDGDGDGGGNSGGGDTGGASEAQPAEPQSSPATPAAQQQNAGTAQNTTPNPGQDQTQQNQQQTSQDKDQKSDKDKDQAPSDAGSGGKGGGGQGKGERGQTSKPDNPPKGAKPIRDKAGNIIGWLVPSQDGKGTKKTLDWGKANGLDPANFRKAATAATYLVVTYWVVSEALRVLFPPRNLIPLP